MPESDDQRGCSQTKDAHALPKPKPVIDAEVCKGCGRCVAACPKRVLRLRSKLNRSGIKPAEYVGEGCTGCAVCFYNCPEPHAIQIHKPDKPSRGA